MKWNQYKILIYRNNLLINFVMDPYTLEKFKGQKEMEKEDIIIKMDQYMKGKY